MLRAEVPVFERVIESIFPVLTRTAPNAKVVGVALILGCGETAAKDVKPTDAIEARVELAVPSNVVVIPATLNKFTSVLRMSPATKNPPESFTVAPPLRPSEGSFSVGLAGFRKLTTDIVVSFEEAATTVVPLTEIDETPDWTEVC